MKESICLKLVKVFIPFILTLVFIGSAKGQEQNLYAQLGKADSLLNLGQIQPAIQILSRLESQFWANEDLIRTLGKAYYWSQDFEQTKDYFRQRIDENPSFLQVKLDYARILYELQEWQESGLLLDSLHKDLPKDPEINQKLAEINYWLGGNKNISIRYLEAILKDYPDNPSAIQFKNEIERETASVLSIHSGYYSDSQPMNYGLLGATFNWYQSSKFQPTLSLESRFYQDYDPISSLSVKNKFGFFSTQTSFSLSMGTVLNPAWDNPVLTYSGMLEQSLGNNFSISGEYAKEAYLYTLASLNQAINPQLASFRLFREPGKLWSGNLQLDQRTFDNSNKLQTVSLWFLARVFKSPKFEFQLGYAGILSDTDSVQFEPASSSLFPISPPEFGALVPGVYAPYFSPINQAIHGILAKASWNLTRTQSFNITGNYGVFAEIENPNIYYFGPEFIIPSPIDPSDLFLIFNTERYQPVDLKIDYLNEFSQKTALSISYQYQKTIFFDSHFLKVNLIQKF